MAPFLVFVDSFWGSVWGWKHVGGTVLGGTGGWHRFGQFLGWRLWGWKHVGGTVLGSRWVAPFWAVLGWVAPFWGGQVGGTVLGRRFGGDRWVAPFWGGQLLGGTAFGVAPLLASLLAPFTAFDPLCPAHECDSVRSESFAVGARPTPRCAPEDAACVEL